MLTQFERIHATVAVTRRASNRRVLAGQIAPKRRGKTSCKPWTRKFDLMFRNLEAGIELGRVRCGGTKTATVYPRLPRDYRPADRSVTLVLGVRIVEMHIHEINVQHVNLAASVQVGMKPIWLGRILSGNPGAVCFQQQKPAVAESD